ncbi:hypothetical protein JCM10908_004225 [Rhodotorula pacifica]|uniref:uncharacterized protein n=1 Tax=Rhodotorula pacifica TaxID=1495444 RepID=UPI00317A71AB
MTATTQQTQTHARRRSRVSIQILPESKEQEEDDFSEKRSLADSSEKDATDQTYLLGARRQSHSLPIELGGRQGANGGTAPARKKPLRALSVLALVAATSCFTTAFVLQLFRRPGLHVTSEVDERPTICDPYAEFGVLNVSLETPRENVWQPVASAPECQPVNWVDLIVNADLSRTADARLDHLRGRSIVVYGDSIDRDHVEDVCGFVGGRHELIHDQHPLSPPYPPDEEVPPPGYKNPITGERTWLQNGQSRPWICHIPQLDTRIINVFHFGFQDLSDFLLNSPHYYPPAGIEDRFDSIVVPLVAAVAKQYGTSASPDLVSIAPGFWTLLRETVDKQQILEKQVDNGVPYDEAKAQWRAQVWRTPSEWSRTFYEKRIAQIMRHVATAWPATTSTPQPFLLWRAPHFVKESDRTPYNRLVALDQIGRSVMSRLVAEGKAAVAGGRRWAEWTKSAAAKSDGFNAASRSWARRATLDRRLKVDEWGSRMLGQARHFRDDIHPNPLPGSYLYGNMLFHHLTTVLESPSS